jgi:ABC-2 type transport system permease protein
MRKYFILYKLALQDQFSDAGKTFIWILVGAAESFVMAFTWMVIAQGTYEVGGLKLSEVISYYFYLFITWYIIGGVFHQMIAETIKKGNLSMYLVKPMFPYAKPILHEQAWKTFGLISGLPILILFLIVFRDNVSLEFNIERLVLSFPAVIFGAIIFGELEFIVGNVTHWTQSNVGIHHLNDLAYALFGGYLAPIVLLPVLLQQISTFVPFRYVFAFPIDIFQGRIQSKELIQYYLFQIGWAIILWFACKFIYKAGLRKYEAFGN